MELVIAFVSALLGVSVAFFLSISFYDLLPTGWWRFGRRARAVTDSLGGRRPLLPRSIHHTTLD
jgi:hypothetical protein